MVNVDYLRPGDLVFGRNQRGADGRWKQPIFEVVSKENDGMILVQERNVRSEPPVIQRIDPYDLYSVKTTMNYLRRWIAGLRVEKNLYRGLLVEMGATAVQESPDLAEQLGDTLKNTVDSDDPACSEY